MKLREPNHHWMFAYGKSFIAGRISERARRDDCIQSRGERSWLPSEGLVTRGVPVHFAHEIQQNP